MRSLALILLLVAATASGCRRHVIVHEKANGDVVVIERGHIHSDHCGHYYHGGHWRFSSGHVHQHGCGHVHRGGMWIVVD